MLDCQSFVTEKYFSLLKLHNYFQFSCFNDIVQRVLYGKLRFCERGISGGNSEVCKKAKSFKLN